VDFSHPTFLQIFLTASLPIMGLAYALVGGLKLSLVDRLQIDEGKVGRLVGGFGMTFGPTILLCGFLTDAVGRKGVWLAGSVAVAASILILARTRTYHGALVAVVLLGIGWAAQVNVSNVLMRVAVPADRPREQLVWATNFFDFAFGFGAFVTPMVLALILRRFGYSKGLLLLAMLATTPLVLGAAAEMHPPPAAAQALSASGPIAQTTAASGSAALLSSPVFWVLGFAFLFFVPLETSAAGWATTLVLRQTPPDVPEPRAKRFAALTLSGFWLGFTGSRLIASILGATGILTRLLGSTNEQALLVALGVGCFVLMLALVFVRGRAATSATILLAGLACGPVFPTMMAVVLLSVQPDTMGRAVGFFFFFASVGWTVVPMLIGLVARKTNIQRGFLVAAASGAVFLTLIVIRGMMIG
jgi:MFS transporter, FHS family, glucose/mannose:H+ symporter